MSTDQTPTPKPESRRRRFTAREREFLRTHGRDVVVALVVTLTAAAAISAWAFNRHANDTLDNVEAAQVKLDNRGTKLDKQQAALDARDACQQGVFEDVLHDLKARSSFAETQAQIQIAADRSQLAFLLALPDAQNTEPFEEYVQQLRFKIKSEVDQLKVRTNNPYPSQYDIQSCR